MYCLNNPIKYVDYGGDSISLAAINIYDKDKGTNYIQNIIDDLSSQTGLSITVSSNGNLEYAKDKKGGYHYHNGSGVKGKGKGTKGYGSKSGKVNNNVHYEYKKK